MYLDLDEGQHPPGLEEEAGAASCDDDDINEGSDRANKVVSSFGAEDDNDGNDHVNKVASSSVAGHGEVNKKGSEMQMDDDQEANDSGGGKTSCGLSVAVMSCKAEVISGSIDAVGEVPCSKVDKCSDSHVPGKKSGVHDDTSGGIVVLEDKRQDPRSVDSSAEERTVVNSKRLGHAKVNCKSIRKYRITVKGPATCGSGCCRGT